MEHFYILIMVVVIQTLYMLSTPVELYTKNSKVYSQSFTAVIYINSFYYWTKLLNLSHHEYAYIDFLNIFGVENENRV